MTERVFQLRTPSGHMARARLLTRTELDDVLHAHGFPRVPECIHGLLWEGRKILDSYGYRLWRLSREGER